MAHPIFNIPEILRLICKELGSDDLVPLLTVSHRFFISAIPIVWEHVPRSGKLRNLVFPDVDMKKIDGAWLNVGGLDPDRFDPDKLVVLTNLLLIGYSAIE